MDQSFSPANLRIILEQENKRGRFLAGRYFSDVASVSNRLKDIRAQIRVLRAELRGKESSNDDSLNQLYGHREQLKEEMEGLLERRMIEVSEKIYQSNFAFRLTEVTCFDRKKAYRIQDSAEELLAIKHLQRNIRKLFSVKPASRDLVIEQLVGVLGNAMPKVLVRTDIKSFYESIPQQRLIQYMREDGLLTKTSLRLINGLLRNYNQVSGRSDGLPRGVGLSAYLAELFMRSIDRNIKSHPDLIFYARYVDDIVAVFVPGVDVKPGWGTEILKSIVTDQGLHLNEDKTNEFHHHRGINLSFDYLGYKILMNGGDVSVGMSDMKRSKLELRIESSFERYWIELPHNKRHADRMLVRRMRFLTGNTRLAGNKGRILIGSYFSNSLLTDDSSLRYLDQRLQDFIAMVNSPQVQNRLRILSFVEGFHRRTFSEFSPKEIRDMVKPWRYNA